MNEVGHHGTPMHTLITNEGAISNEVISLSDANQWSNGNKAQSQNDLSTITEDSQNTPGGEINPSKQLAVTSTKHGEHKTITVDVDFSNVPGAAPISKVNGSSVVQYNF